jgi:membrane protein required for colicin V production
MIIDFICVIIALYGFWVGYSRGIIKTVLTAASFLFGFMAAVKFSPTVSVMLLEWFDTMPPSLGLAAAFILTLVLTLILFRMLANGLENMLEAVNINFINQVMGGGISMLFFVFLYSVLVSFADSSRLIDPPTKEESFTYDLLEPIPDYAWTAGKKVWPVFQEFYQHAMDVMDKIDKSVDRQENDRFFDVDDKEDESEPPSRPWD